MNRKLSIICTTIISGFLLTYCGPSAKEFEEKRVSDSIRVSDSLAMISNISNELNLSTKTPDDKQFIKTAETKFLVSNVRTASEKIEDLAKTYAGYVTNSDLRNQESDYEIIDICKDSVLILKKIIVKNDLILRIPNERLDSLVRELNNLIVFLDYRIVKMDEITFNLLANQKESERLKTYDLRQKKHIDDKENKLKETTTAEENILNRQMQADKLQVANLELNDQIKYCTLTIFIYQKPLLYKETQVRFDKNSFRGNLFYRILDAVIDGWVMFEYFIVFLFRIWWLLVIVIGGILIYKFWRKSRKNK
jgi:hypothetical protein